MAQIFEILDHIDEDVNIISVKSDSDTLDKGYLCSLGSLAYWDVYNVTKPTGTEGGTPAEADLVMILGGDPYEDSGQRTGGKRDPRNITYAAGRIVAAARIPLGCRIKINEDAIDATGGTAIAVGKYLIPKNGGYDMATSATIPSGVGFVLKIDKLDSFPVGGEYVDAVVARRVV